MTLEFFLVRGGGDLQLIIKLTTAFKSVFLSNYSRIRFVSKSKALTTLASIVKWWSRRPKLTSSVLSDVKSIIYILHLQSSGRYRMTSTYAGYRYCLGKVSPLYRSSLCCPMPWNDPLCPSPAPPPPHQQNTSHKHKNKQTNKTKNPANSNNKNSKSINEPNNYFRLSFPRTAFHALCISVYYLVWKIPFFWVYSAFEARKSGHQWLRLKTNTLHTVSAM